MSEGFVLTPRTVPGVEFFRNARIGTCALCMSKGGKVYDVGAMSPDYRYCRDCIEQRGVQALRRGADEALAVIGANSSRVCRHCGGPVLAPSKGFPSLVCAACEDEWRRLPGQLGVSES